MTYLLLTLLILNTPISEIHFSGNKSISDKALREELISKKGDEYNDIGAEFDMERILRYYRTQGFFSIIIDSQTESKDKGIEISFIIEEGKRPKVENIIILGAQDEDLKHLKKLCEIKPEDFFIETKIMHTEEGIKNYYKNKGYAYAEVRSSMMPDSGILRLNIEKGVLYYIRDIEIIELRTCNPEVVRREIDFKKGDRFDKSKLLKSQRRIYGVGFFSTIKVELVKHEPDSIDLIYKVKELKSRILKAGAGLSVSSSALDSLGSLSFLISLGVEELNLFNRGHRCHLRPSFETNTKREWELRLEGRYTIPYVTSLKLTISTLPFLWFEETEGFTRQTRGNEFRISKALTDNIQLSVANRYKFVNITPKTELEYLDTLRKGITNSIKCQLIIDYRNEFFNPKTGIYVVPLAEYAGGVFGGINNYLRLEIEKRAFFQFLHNTVAQRLKLGIIIPTNGITISEKYHLGGQYSLRGYPERSIGPDSLDGERYGEILGNYNLEYRIGLPFNFGVVGFLDVGYINNEMDLANRDYLKASTGFGLRYYTPIGPVRCDIGFPLMDEGREFYLGIYHIF